MLMHGVALLHRRNDSYWAREFVTHPQQSCWGFTATDYLITSDGARGSRVHSPAPSGTSSPVTPSVAPTVSAASAVPRNPAIVSSWTTRDPLPSSTVSRRFPATVAVSVTVVPSTFTSAASRRPLS